MSIATTYDFDWREHYRATRAVTRLTWLRWTGWAIGLVVLGMVALTIRATAGKMPTASVLLNLAPWLVLCAVWVAIIPYTQWRAAKKLPTRDASVQGPQERIVDDTGYHSRGNGVALDIPWHAMARGVETEQFFLFFYNKQCAYYVPKRALGSEERAGVRQLMREKLSGRAVVS
jgi:hypothetical protein